MSAFERKWLWGAATVVVFVVLGLSGEAVLAAPGGGYVETRAGERAAPIVAVRNVCAWPNLTVLRDGTIIAVFHNQPSHGGREGDVDCWASCDGLTWEKRSTVTRHEPNTIRMNHAAGLARNGDLVVLCSGWTNTKQPERPKQAAFRDAVLSAWILRSADGGRHDVWQGGRDRR